MYRHCFSDSVINRITEVQNGDIAATADCIVGVTDFADNTLKIALRDLLITQVTRGNPMNKLDLNDALAGTIINHFAIYHSSLSQ